MIKTRLLSLALLFCCAGLHSQELRLDEFPALRDKAMVLYITTTIAENSQEIWNAFNSKVTIPGRPVGIKLVGDNLIIAVQFTPYLRQGKFALVAQSEIWINIPDKGMSYKTNTHSIPMDFGEPIIYFPLGSAVTSDTPHIELLLTLYRYGEEPPIEETGKPGSVPEEPKQAEIIQPRRERNTETTTESPRPGRNR